MTKMSQIITDQIRVLLADDHRMIIDMFQLFLTDAASMEVTTAETLDQAADILAAEGSFDVVLLDLNMPGMNGVNGLKRALRLNDGKPVAILTGNAPPRMMQEIMATGAAGIVLKTTPLRSLANAIRFMHAGERYLPMELVQMSTSATSAQNGELSQKETDVLGHLAEGLSNKEIAHALDLAEATVKMHVTGICRKIGANNRTHAVIIAKEMGLV
ncbi:MAG: response regulator transcription factor [Rhodobacteraceae bacterium]|nr:response regulator transcription factor [Paracoccaceae bacterium]